MVADSSWMEGLMRKFALPTTVVPNARKNIDPDTLKPVWDMPKPTGKHETLQVVKERYEDAKGKPKTRKVKRKLSFPIYRGTTASFARYMRAQMRRALREMKEQEQVSEGA